MSNHADPTIPLNMPATPRKVNRWRKWRPYLIIAPAFLLTIGIMYPFLTAVWYSFTNYSLTRPTFEFIAFKNYRIILQDPSFWNAVSVTVRYALGAVAVEMLLGLGIALLLNQEHWLAKALRYVLIFPLMISPVIGTLIWKLMMSPSVGILNYYLSKIGIKDFPWAASQKTAMMSVVLVDVWIFTPFVGLLLLAGLRSLPRAPYEAATLDGGSAWFTFKTLTLPMLMPYMMVCLMFRLIDSLKMFDIIYAMTGGGPGDSLMNFSLQAYFNGFLYLNLAYGLAYMIILWLIVYIISQVLSAYWGKAQKRAVGQ
ncbi:MAG TPA: sugar ABC transporter permease [Symbiobacteriaceae bacterium]|nr:sugar ABC transporter permease [Symbiobacteriaceae bacterium]